MHYCIWIVSSTVCDTLQSSLLIALLQSNSDMSWCCWFTCCRTSCYSVTTVTVATICIVLARHSPSHLKVNVLVLLLMQKSPGSWFHFLDYLYSLQVVSLTPGYCDCCDDSGQVAHTLYSSMVEKLILKLENDID